MWRFVKTDGNPTKEGFYYCTLIAELYKDGNPTGQRVAYGDSRSFEDVTNIVDNYRMKGQPLTGLAWTRDSDGYNSEEVYAWTTDTTDGVCEVPEDVRIIKILDQGE